MGRLRLVFAACLWDNAAMWLRAVSDITKRKMPAVTTSYYVICVWKLGQCWPKGMSVSVLGLGMIVAMSVQELERVGRPRRSEASGIAN